MKYRAEQQVGQQVEQQVGQQVEQPVEQQVGQQVEQMSEPDQDYQHYYIVNFGNDVPGMRHEIQARGQKKSFFFNEEFENWIEGKIFRHKLREYFKTVVVVFDDSVDLQSEKQRKIRDTISLLAQLDQRPHLIFLKAGKSTSQRNEKFLRELFKPITKSIELHFCQDIRNVCEMVLDALNKQPFVEESQLSGAPQMRLMEVSRSDRKQATLIISVAHGQISLQDQIETGPHIIAINSLRKELKTQRARISSIKPISQEGEQGTQAAFGVKYQIEISYESERNLRDFYDTTLIGAAGSLPSFDTKFQCFMNRKKELKPKKLTRSDQEMCLEVVYKQKNIITRKITKYPFQYKIAGDKLLEE